MTLHRQGALPNYWPYPGGETLQRRIATSDIFNARNEISKQANFPNDPNLSFSSSARASLPNAAVFVSTNDGRQGLRTPCFSRAFARPRGLVGSCVLMSAIARGLGHVLAENAKVQHARYSVGYYELPAANRSLRFPMPPPTRVGVATEPLRQSSRNRLPEPSSNALPDTRRLSVSPERSLCRQRRSPCRRGAARPPAFSRGHRPPESVV